MLYYKLEKGKGNFLLCSSNTNVYWFECLFFSLASKMKFYKYSVISIIYLITINSHKIESCLFSIKN